MVIVNTIMAAIGYFVVIGCAITILCLVIVNARENRKADKRLKELERKELKELEHRIDILEQEVYTMATVQEDDKK